MKALLLLSAVFSCLLLSSVLCQQASKERAQFGVLAAFAAESHALGPHWVYDVTILQKHGRITDLIDPLSNYHQTKHAGDFTHYGDQALWLLDLVTKNDGFDLYKWADLWRSNMKTYTGFLDTATNVTLKNFAAGATPETSGSTDHDLAGGSRATALFLKYYNDSAALQKAIVQQTKMTHNNEAVILAAQYFSFVAVKVFAGEKPSRALVEALVDMLDVPYQNQTVYREVLELIHKGLAADPSTDTTDQIIAFGQSCNYLGALPSSVYVINKYEEDIENALIDNGMAGGDTAGRSLYIGLILGAYLKQTPHWTKNIHAYQYIIDRLQ